MIPNHQHRIPKIIPVESRNAGKPCLSSARVLTRARLLASGPRNKGPRGAVALAACAMRVSMQVCLGARARVCVSTRARTQNLGLVWRLRVRNRVGDPDGACLGVELGPFFFLSKPFIITSASTKGWGPDLAAAPPVCCSQSPQGGRGHRRLPLRLSHRAGRA